MRTRNLVFALLLLAAPVQAQTSAVTTLVWDLQGVTMADVITYATTIVVNGTPVTVPPVCVTKGADVTCSVPVPNLNQAGGNTIAITNTKGDQSALTTITGLSGTSTLRNASRPRVNVTVTINVQ